VRGRIGGGRRLYRGNRDWFKAQQGALVLLAEADDAGGSHGNTRDFRAVPEGSISTFGVLKNPGTAIHSQHCVPPGNTWISYNNVSAGVPTDAVFDSAIQSVN
jgi:hypothetical protein